MKRVAVTGSSGYLGRKFLEHMRRRHGAVETLGIDICSPSSASASPDRFVALDILSTELAGIVRDFQPDTIVHAAFVLAPIRDRKRMRRINVDGCRNVLAAASGVERMMLVSSATVYGAWPDNPVPMDESQPLRASTFQYAADKVAIESLAKQFAEQHPGVAVSHVRPAIIGGEGMDNFLYRFIFDQMLVVLLDGYDTPVQFVHEDDVAAAMLAILTADARGVFNIGPPNWCQASEIAAETRRRLVRLPFRLMKIIHGLAWAARLPGHESPAEFLDFARYPWVVAPRRLEQELGFRFRYTSRETLLETIRSRQPSEKGRLTAAR
jgi:UDP-glucose 4-epimerase